MSGIPSTIGIANGQAKGICDAIVDRVENGSGGIPATDGLPFQEKTVIDAIIDRVENGSGGIPATDGIQDVVIKQVLDAIIDNI